MFAISLFLFVAFVVGAIVCFEDIIAIHPVCAESIQIVYNEKTENPFSIPEDMVFYTEASDMDFWPSTDDTHAYNVNAIHKALITFWRVMDTVGDLIEEALALDLDFDNMIVELDNEREQDEDKLATWFFWTGDLACTDWATA